MSVYVVSWGLAKGPERIELDAIVHSDCAVALQEYDLVDVDAIARGKMERLRGEGWGTYCTLTQVAMLDEAEKPTDSIECWAFDGVTELLKEKHA